MITAEERYCAPMVVSTPAILSSLDEQLLDQPLLHVKAAAASRPPPSWQGDSAACPPGRAFPGPPALCSGSARGTGCPVRSMIFAISPPRASISFTRWPLARPPMAGLQDMSAMLSRFMVSMSVEQPMRAEAKGSLAAGMAGADHDDVVFFLKAH